MGKSTAEQRQKRRQKKGSTAQLRFLPARDFVSLLYHVSEAQRQHREALIRAAETIAESRLGARRWSIHELERLTVDTSESLYYEFLDELTENFRQILYGREEDVVGIHILSYFIGRSIPQLRDRPTSRRTPGHGADRGQQILASIAEIIPLAKQGSLLRAISHNQAQTVVLGMNQLTTGLFRALERFASRSLAEGDRERVIAERLLLHLPVYEILSRMRRFLLGAIEYLNSFAEGDIEVPVSIIRAMNDVERIAQIEESALPPAKQDVIRCCILQIARLAAENG